ncbi:hypothetical protein K353_00889 [Kitasatospora sp. SolWspMP-SS2h]|uniref:hypothetical protein n=1 Tax=Kitasatospora sp. SolWspMP-SS2h TaxID=1305729 RepID=UPI000DBFA02F|nr:hypothetical protein [Kitasatospora sp. SolWspMP-SS2h]RAJ45391.1 hypothetical protein K353_00889 [Kitasatospora sp. SolWspMP-SS2h]
MKRLMLVGGVLTSAAVGASVLCGAGAATAVDEAGSAAAAGCGLARAWAAALNGDDSGARLWQAQWPQAGGVPQERAPFDGSVSVGRSTRTGLTDLVGMSPFAGPVGFPGVVSLPGVSAAAVPAAAADGQDMAVRTAASGTLGARPGPEGCRLEASVRARTLGLSIPAAVPGADPFATAGSAAVEVRLSGLRVSVVAEAGRAPEFTMALSGGTVRYGGIEVASIPQDPAPGTRIRIPADPARPMVAEVVLNDRTAPVTAPPLPGRQSTPAAESAFASPTSPTSPTSLTSPMSPMSPMSPTATGLSGPTSPTSSTGPTASTGPSGPTTPSGPSSSIGGGAGSAGASIDAVRVTVTGSEARQAVLGHADATLAETVGP